MSEQNELHLIGGNAPVSLWLCNAGDVAQIAIDKASRPHIEPQHFRHEKPRRMPSRAKIFRHWQSTVRTHSEKFCFVCRLEQRHANLERAHLVPRCHGGSDDPSNIMLMCKMCHKMTEYFLPEDWEKVFFTRGWVKR